MNTISFRRPLFIAWQERPLSTILFIALLNVPAVILMISSMICLFGSSMALNDDSRISVAWNKITGLMVFSTSWSYLPYGKRVNWNVEGDVSTQVLALVTYRVATLISRSELSFTFGIFERKSMYWNVFIIPCKF